MTLQYVFYHYPCNDGELAQIIWKTKYPDSIYIKWNHVEKEKVINIFNNIKEPSDIIFLDLCPYHDLPTIHNYTIIDHHNNPIKNINAYIEKHNFTNIKMYCDITKSGCMLTWNYLYADEKNNNYPLIIHHIGNKDLWIFSDTNTEPYCIGYNNNNNNETIIMKLLKDDNLELHTEFIQSGIKIIIDNISKAEKYFNTKTFSFENIDNITYNIIDIKCHANNMFKYLIDYAAGEYPDIDILRILYSDNEDKSVYSLRSLTENTIVDSIARKYGGNGHPKAAGYTIYKTNL